LGRVPYDYPEIFKEVLLLEKNKNLSKFQKENFKA